MKPGFGPVFQFRVGFSFGSSVDDLWMALKIVAGTRERLRSQQAKPISHVARPPVRHGGAP